MNRHRRSSSLALLAAITASAIAQAPFQRLADFGFGGIAYDINPQGVVVGGAISPDSHTFVPTLWDSVAGQAIELPTGPVNPIFNGRNGGFATAVNVNRVAVGGRHSIKSTDNPSVWIPIVNPTVWQNNEYTELPTLGHGGVALDINNANEIVGYVLDGERQRPALWKNGQLTVLPFQTIGQADDRLDAIAARINDAGDIIGTVKVAFGSDSLTLKWNGTLLSAFGLPTWQETRAVDLNERGDVLVQGYLGLEPGFTPAIVSPNLTVNNLGLPENPQHVVATSFSNTNISSGYYQELIAGVTPIIPIAWRDLTVLPLELPTGFDTGIPLSAGDTGTIVGYIGNRDRPDTVAGYWQVDAAGSGDTITLAANGGFPGDEVVLTAVIKGKNIANRDVLFQVDNRDYARVKSNSTGRARVRYAIAPGTRAGDYEVMASMGGGRYSRAKLRVEWIQTELTAKSPTAAPGQTVSISGTLMNTSHNRAMGNQTVRARINGQLHSATTASNGAYRFRYTVPANAPRNTDLRVDLAFGGNSNHRSATARTSVRVR
ncbi:MAG: hypothetical protein SFX74_09140 [Fimbriimonadaceae bacterium]|nr:hypothetical protein [Fimbriimonadaceae bacterium]